MNDDELSIHAELASAYLDGDLDAAQRASAAADPDVMALVDSFTRVRGALRDVDPVVDSTRTAAMAAALAEFDARQSRADVAPERTAAKVTSLNTRRMRAYRVLTGVAAAAVVGVVAVAALNSTNSNDDLSTAVEISAARNAGSPDLKVSDPAGGAPADTAVAADSATAETPSFESAVVLPEIDSAEALMAYAATVENLTLAAPAAQADQTAAPSDAATEEAVAPSCLASNQNVIGSIIFQETLAFAVRDTSSGALRAIDASDCRVLMEVEAP